MSRLNAPNKFTETTYEGAKAARTNSLQRLRRSVLSCLLWEKEFYEDGKVISDRIIQEAGKVSPAELANLAVEARTKYNLRHVPLLLLSVLSRTGSGSSLVSDTIYRTIERADELSEFLAVHAKVNGVDLDKIKPIISAQMKLGLARAFGKFDAYQLAKYDREGAIRLRDVLFLCHPKPADTYQELIWKNLVEGKLDSPDTWEVRLSTGQNKKEVFEDLLSKDKLGYLALLRNLRNMQQSGCNKELVVNAILARKGAARVLPFRYVAAARAVPEYEKYIDEALMAAIGELPEFIDTTIILVDVSGSMDNQMSEKSDLKRIDAAAALASIISGNIRVFTFSNDVLEVPARRGMAGVDAVIKSQQHRSTNLASAIQFINGLSHDRLIVISDEQATREYGFKALPDPVCKRAYMINVASNKNGVGYGKWNHIDGFSENVIRFIHEIEKFIEE